jgi:transposase-like protein
LEDIGINCRHCGSESIVKAGFQSKKQRYKCKECGRVFVERSQRGMPAELKAQTIALYLEGLEFRAIGRLLGVSNVAALKWIRLAANRLPQPSENAFVDVLELDELWHFVKKRLNSSGCGLRLTVSDVPSLTSRQVAVVYKPSSLSGKG